MIDPAVFGHEKQEFNQLKEELENTKVTQN